MSGRVGNNHLAELEVNCDMRSDAENQLHQRVRQTYVSERRKFELRLTGRPSSYGISPMPKWDGTDDVRPGSTRRGVQDRYGKNYKPIWPKIADFALKAGVDPIELIRTRFSTTRGPRPPEPTDCMSKSALDLCINDAVPVDELNQQLYEYFKSLEIEAENRSVYISRHGWTPEKVVISIVRDLTLPFSPLFRHHLAVVNGIDDMVQMTRSPALIEYLRQKKSYDKSLWKEIIPKDLVDEAELALV